MRYLIAAVTVAPLLLASMAARADSDAPSISISGFGTIGAVQTDSNEGQFGVPLQPEGADRSAAFSPDSKLGLQVSGSLNSMLSGTVQALSRYRYNGEWSPKIEWAFAKAQLGSSASVKVGRIGAPFFMVSDFRTVGYANLWIRPPVDVYGQGPFNTFDGADLSYKGTAEDVNLNGQVFVGRSSVPFSAGVNIKLKNLWGVNGSAELGPLTLRAGYSRAKLNQSGPQGLDDLLEGLRAASQVPGLESLAAYADQLSPVNKIVTFAGVGMSLDWNDFVGSAEYTRLRAHSTVSDTTGWYVTAGHRWGQWAPYVTFSRIRQDSATAGDPLLQSPGLEELAAGVSQVLASVGQRSTAVGVRWDAYKGVAVKAQLDRIRVDSGAVGQFINPQPGLSGSTVNVYGLAVDFVW